MLRGHCLLPVFSLCISLLLVSCGDGGTSPPVVATVVPQPSTVTFTYLGETQQISAQARTADGTVVQDATFTYSSSDASVASVSATGLVEAEGPGTATVSVTVSDGAASGSVSVTVQQVTDGLALSPTEATIVVGGTQQLTVVATDEGGAAIDDPTVSYSSSDESVATVSGSGLVTGEDDGGATITASSGSVQAQATITVEQPDVTIDVDTELSGEVNADEFSISDGVTVTVTDDLVLRATGEVTIEGDITGDCKGIELQGDTAVTVMGKITNGCSSDASEGQDLSVTANGELTLDGATLESSGNIELTNDPTLTEDDFEAGAEPLAPVIAAVRGVPYTWVNNTTMRFAGGVTGPNPAKPGTDGVDGTDGADGRVVKALLRGNAVFAGGTRLWGQDAGRGGNGTEVSNNTITVEGGDGGDGGTIKVLVTGTLTYQGAGNVVQTGAGGDGGSATATTTQNNAGAKAPSATAEAGNGGMPGLLSIKAGGGISGAGNLTIQVGDAGAGGNATAKAADGVDAANGNPAQEGGDATAMAGVGGDTPDETIVKVGTVAGVPSFVRADGGNGGMASAQAGNGGDGNEASPPGANGGANKVKGGDGGDALLKTGAALGAGLLGDGGKGGKAMAANGNGGDGWKDCQQGNLKAGGAGGDGGKVSGSDGEGGTGIAAGSHGNLEITNAANGGKGGDGQPLGTGGKAGAEDTAGRHGSRTVLTSFNPGADGAACAAPQPKQGKIGVGAIPNNGGIVPQGTHMVPIILSETGETVGQFPITTTGTGGNNFAAMNPDRLGAFGPDGWRFDFGASEFTTGTGEFQSTTLCFANTEGVNAANPLRIQSQDAQGNVLSEATWYPGAAVQEGMASEETNCRMVTLSPAVVFLTLVVPSFAVMDVLAPLVILLLTIGA